MATVEYRTVACGDCGCVITAARSATRFCSACAKARRLEQERTKHQRRYRPVTRPVLACPTCGTEVTQGSRGRLRKYCSYKCGSRRNGYVRVDHQERACPACSSLFKPNSAAQTYCGRTCQVASYRPDPEKLPETSPSRFMCEHCGKPSARKLGGQSKRKPYKNRWCSMQYKKDAAALVRIGPYSVVRFNECKQCGKQWTSKHAHSFHVLY